MAMKPYPKNNSLHLSTSSSTMKPYPKYNFYGHFFFPSSLRGSSGEVGGDGRNFLLFLWHRDGALLIRRTKFLIGAKAKEVKMVALQTGGWSAEACNKQSLRHISQIAQETNGEIQCSVGRQPVFLRALSQRLCRGFKYAVNGIVDDGWSIMDSDGADDVTIAINSSPVAAHFSGIQSAIHKGSFLLVVHVSPEDYQPLEALMDKKLTKAQQSQNHHQFQFGYDARLQLCYGNLQALKEKTKTNGEVILVYHAFHFHCTSRWLKTERQKIMQCLMVWEPQIPRLHHLLGRLFQTVQRKKENIGWQQI